MAFIYHRYPENMTGNTIYPMSELREKFPALFTAREKHHEFQPKVLEGSIPRLGCFWNDTLHFTALHPNQISEALHKFGYNIKLKYFEIEAEKLEHEKTIVFLNKPKLPGVPLKVTDFIDFDYTKISEWAHISEQMNNRAKTIPTSDEFLLNYGAPYILYKGNLDITGAKIVEV